MFNSDSKPTKKKWIFLNVRDFCRQLQFGMLSNISAWSASSSPFIYWLHHRTCPCFRWIVFLLRKSLWLKISYKIVRNNTCWTNTLFKWLASLRANCSRKSLNRCCCCFTAWSISCPKNKKNFTEYKMYSNILYVETKRTRGHNSLNLTETKSETSWKGIQLRHYCNKFYMLDCSVTKTLPGRRATFIHCRRASAALVQASMPREDVRSPSWRAFMWPLAKSMWFYKIIDSIIHKRVSLLGCWTKNDKYNSITIKNLLKLVQ